MSLPLLNTLTYDIVLPSTNSKIKIRPYLVGEEKALLMALESEEESATIEAIKNLIKSCIVTKGIDIDDLPMFDLEFLFLELRKISVGAKVELKIGHQKITNCHETHSIKIDINDIKMNKKFDKHVKIDDEVVLLMRAPTTRMIEQNSKNSSNVSKGFALIRECIEGVAIGEEMYSATDSTPEEIDTWIDNLNLDQLSKIYDFFNSLPKLYYEFEDVCPHCQQKETIKLEGLQTFL